MAPFSHKRIRQICSNVGVSLRAGLDLRTCWATEAQRLSGRNQDLMMAVVELMTRGSSLSDGIEEVVPDLFPPLMKGMIRVGEHTGRLAEVFEQLADHYDHKLQLKRIILQGIAWPLFELAFAIAVITAMILIFGMIDGAGLDGEPVSILGLRGGKGALIFLSFVALALSPVLFLLIGFRRAWFPIDPVIGVLSRVPMLGRAIRTMALSRICWTMAMAHNAGIDAISTLKMAIKSAQNPIYSRAGRRAEEVLKQNRSFLEAFRAAGVFPHDLLAAVETGELAGQLSETMMAFSTHCLERARQQFKTLAFVLGILVFMLVAGLMIAAIFILFKRLYLDPINNALEGF